MSVRGFLMHVPSAAFLGLWPSTLLPAAVPPELASPRFTYSPAVGLGLEAGITRRDPSDVIKVGPDYYVYYTRTNHGPSGYDATVWYATSPDGKSWTERGEVLARGGAGAWDEASVFTPNILAAEGRYYLFYTAIPRNDDLARTPTAIGVAVSDSPDGPWRRFAGNPVIRPGRPVSRFDSFRVDDACLLVRGGKYWMYYKGRQAGRSPADTKMGLAVAERPTGPFVKSDANPVVDSGHEVLVWPHREGVAALMANAGPQRNTIQYAPDGIRFTRCAKLTNQPMAPGAYRPDAFTNPRIGRGIRWGLSMVPGKDPYLRRYDCNLTVEPERKLRKVKHDP